MEYRGFELIDIRELHYEHGAVDNLIYTLWTQIAVPTQCLSCSNRTNVTISTTED